MGKGQITQVSLHPNVYLTTPKQKYSNIRVLDREKTVNTMINKLILNYYYLLLLVLCDLKSLLVTVFRALCSPSWPQTLYVAKNNLELLIFISTSQTLGL